MVRNRYRSPRNRLRLSSIGRPDWSKVTACVHNSGAPAPTSSTAPGSYPRQRLDVVVGSGRDHPGRAELVVQRRLGEVGTDEGGRDGNGDPGELQPDRDVLQEAKPPQLEDRHARGQ